MGAFDFLFRIVEPKRYTMDPLEELTYLCEFVPKGDSDHVDRVVKELRPRLRQWMELHPGDDVGKVKRDFRKAQKSVSV
jgi:hypothetical protein